MKFGIIGAMSSEVELLINALEDLKTTDIKGYKFFEGKYKDKELVVIESSIGKVNSAICTQILIDNFNPDFVINSGIAGGLDSRLKVLSVVIGEELTFHDFSHEIMRDFSPYTAYFESDNRAVKLAKEIADEMKIHSLVGKIVTGDVFVEDSVLKTKLHSDFDALCVEMEGASIAMTSYINKIPFIVLRSISDLADDGGMMTYDEFKIEASNQSANLVLELVSRY